MTEQMLITHTFFPQWRSYSIITKTRAIFKLHFLYKFQNSLEFIWWYINLLSATTLEVFRNTWWHGWLVCQPFTLNHNFKKRNNTFFLGGGGLFFQGWFIYLTNIYHIWEAKLYMRTISVQRLATSFSSHRRTLLLSALITPSRSPWLIRLRYIEKILFLFWMYKNITSYNKDI